MNKMAKNQEIYQQLSHIKAAIPQSPVAPGSKLALSLNSKFSRLRETINPPGDKFIRAEQKQLIRMSNNLEHNWNALFIAMEKFSRLEAQLTTAHDLRSSAPPTSWWTQFILYCKLILEAPALELLEARRVEYMQNFTELMRSIDAGLEITYCSGDN